MRRMNAPAYSGPLFLSMFLLASVSLHAQAPATGTTVSVKMIDTVNSGSDPAGKQYRASVTKAVTAANGIAIAQGAAATVTLTSSGSDYAEQLSSITVNGQVVAITSNSATVSAVAQYAQEKAASAVGSVLGGVAAATIHPTSRLTRASPSPSRKATAASVPTTSNTWASLATSASTSSRPPPKFSSARSVTTRSTSSASAEVADDHEPIIQRAAE